MEKEWTREEKIAQLKYLSEQHMVISADSDFVTPLKSAIKALETKLVMRDINTDEEMNSIELDRVSSVAVFSGKKINEGELIYGVHANPIEEYIIVQFDGGDGFFAGKKKEVYISFE